MEQSLIRASERARPSAGAASSRPAYLAWTGLNCRKEVGMRLAIRIPEKMREIEGRRGCRLRSGLAGREEGEQALERGLVEAARHAGGSQVIDGEAHGSAPGEAFRLTRPAATGMCIAAPIRPAFARLSIPASICRGRLKMPCGGFPCASQRRFRARLHPNVQGNWRSDLLFLHQRVRPTTA